MSSDRFGRIKEILLAALEQSEDGRAAFVAGRCGPDVELRDEILSLLSQKEGRTGALLGGGMGNLLGGEAGRQFLGDLAPAGLERMGPYRIGEVIGEGGMGLVFRAEQTEPVRREVALKLLGFGSTADTALARFAAERQALAMMEHPNICRLLDAGTDPRGRPFFVMELVRGEPITTFCSDGDVDLKTRLTLMVTVCRAVQHAHQKGIIHRDLKPSNLLVALQDGVPVPKVIDFGIAKFMQEAGGPEERLTLAGSALGTLQYMSPEQADPEAGRVDTRSDVYALGVVLYELVSGRDPYELGGRPLVEQLKLVCEAVPRPLGRVGPRGAGIDGDLETIIAKALRKDPEARYQSVASLGDDLERFLGGQPILARPPSSAYQVRKLVARNVLASALLAGLFVSLLGFSIGMSVLYTRSEQSRKRAVIAEGQAASASDFLTGLFEINDPSEARGNEVTAREILDRGADRVWNELDGQPELQAQIMRTMGRVYRGLGLYAESDSLLTAARDRYGSLGPEHRGTEMEADILDDLGRLKQRQGRWDEAIADFGKALAIKESLFGRRDPKVAATLNNLGKVLLDASRPDSALAAFTWAREIWEASEPDSRMHAATLNNLAEVHFRAGDFGRAESLFLRSLEMSRALLPPFHPDLATSINNLATVKQTLGQWDQASDLMDEVIAIHTKVLGPDHPDLARALLNQAVLLGNQGRQSEAEPKMLQALTIQERALGPDNLQVSATLNSLGRLYQDLARFDDGVAVLERCLRIRREHLGDDHGLVSYPLISLGEIAFARERYDRADSLLSRAMEIRIAEYGPDNARTALAYHDLGLVRLARGDLQGAEDLLSRGLKVRQETLGPAHYRIAESLDACARLYYALDDSDRGSLYETRAAAMWAQVEQ